MNDKPGSGTNEERSTLPARFGRAIFFLCGGLLMSILVSCACGPVR
jgi:hypothetical protein